ncbi:MAG: radical SAM protein [Sedimentisphaerales bacterium]|jgi:radical SAM protein with 4Fe4S-binding SPASM domain
MTKQNSKRFSTKDAKPRAKAAQGRRGAKGELKPRLIAFELTRRCRYECKHCRANAGPDRDSELTTQQCKKIIAAMAKFAKPVLILTGGEPMERPDLYEIIKYAKEKGLRVVMATCGYLLDDESMAKLKKAGVSALAFSIDGSAADTHDRFRQSDGSFDAVMKAAAVARKAKVPFQINTTISKINAGEILGIAELAKRLGASCFNPFMMVPMGRAKEIDDAVLDPVQYEYILGELLRIKLRGDVNVRVTCGPSFARICEQARARGLTAEGSGCIGGRGFGFISYKGDVQTCGFLDISAGNLVANGFNFKKIWLESKFLNEIRDVSAMKDNCGECEYAGLCGGCRARAMAMLGDYLRGDPVCGYVPGKKR